MANLCVIAIPLALIFVEQAGGYGAIDDARDLALEARIAPPTDRR